MLKLTQSGRIAAIGEWALESPEHPLMPAPTREEFARLGYEGAVQLLNQRQAALIAMRDDPFRHGWEPPAWRLADALCEFPWVDKELAASVRKRLGFSEPVKKLFLMGGNRSSKTTWAAKRVMRLLIDGAARRAWMFHQNSDMSVEYHHALIWQFLPQEMRRVVKTQTEYLAYKAQTGFSDDKATFANGSYVSFRNYSQDKATIEGGELDIIVADELCPLDWSKTFDLRTATRDGWVIHPFTPVDGYTPLVGSAREGASIALDSAGWLLPLTPDGAPDRARATELRDVLADALGTGAPEPPEAAKFERMPRIEKCASPRRAVMYFHSSDNPFGNPDRVAGDALAGGPDFTRERFYGLVTKSFSARFAFDTARHVVKPSEIPPKGVNIMVADPASSRNWFMLWARVVGEDVYIYREWPTTWRPCDGHGYVGPWADHDPKKPDGKKGSGQKSLGWGLLRYKEEIARLEGWEDAKPDSPLAKTPAAWSESHGSRDRVYRRIMDSRFASAPKLENDRPETVITQFEDIGLWFDTASGADIDDGEQKIVSLLYYDKSKPLDITNRPRLYVSAECPNVIHALSSYVGINPETGRIDMGSPLKDIIDCLRYALMAGIHDFTATDKAAARTHRRGESTRRYY